MPVAERAHLLFLRGKIVHGITTTIYIYIYKNSKSWKIHYDPVEVGCRGFAGQSLGRALAKIGIVGAARVRALKDITNTVLKASKWIWLKRSEPWKK